MKRVTVGIILIVMSALGSSGKSSEDGTTCALIVTGINKDAKDRQTKDKALLDLRTFLLNFASMKSDGLAMLANSRSLVQNDSEVSTAGNLKARIDTFAAKAKTEDRFVFYYVGQANIVDDKLRLNLPGTDITHEQLAQWLSRIKASSILIVLDCPGAGLAVKTLAAPNRIIIAGCTAKQPYSTRFSEYFVPALADIQSDSDHDGKISLLEAFTSASKKLDDFYRRMGLLKTETPVMDDNADGKPSDQPWKYEQNGSDGRAASRFFLSSRI
ncbi:MAG: hypothetical protein JSW59_03745 [Phycisphaerales bacterium]|nr:MAG: hypothetical protein JSW59_03745 [Phycisphaerales bacterium]